MIEPSRRLRKGNRSIPDSDQPKMTTDSEFVSWITEQLDQILNHERPIRYDDIEDIWRGLIGEIDMFYGMFLATKDIDISIHEGSTRSIMFLEEIQRLLIEFRF